MTRKRSNAIDFNAPNPSAEEYVTKIDLYAACGMYLNFSYNTFVKHADLDKEKVSTYMIAVSERFAYGKANDVLIKHLSKYLEPKEMFNLFIATRKKNNKSSLTHVTAA